MDALASNNNTERTESNTHWQVHDYLENLKDQIEEKAKKIGNKLIHEEEKIDEAKRKKKEEWLKAV